MISTVQSQAGCSKRGRFRTVSCIGGVLFLSACSFGAKPEPRSVPARTVTAVAEPESETRLMGKVIRREGGKEVPVEGASIWTEPVSDDVVTKEDGSWEIRAFLAGRMYRVYAKVNESGETGRTKLIEAKVNATVDRILIILGDDESPWPPDAAYDKLFPKRERQPGGVRVGCCRE